VPVENYGVGQDADMSPCTRILTAVEDMWGPLEALACAEVWKRLVFGRCLEKITFPSKKWQALNT